MTRAPWSRTLTLMWALAITGLLLSIVSISLVVIAARLARAHERLESSGPPVIQAKASVSSGVSGQPTLQACEEVAAGIDRLQAEATIVTSNPRSEGEISSFHYLEDAQKSGWASPDTISLAARGRASGENYFRSLRAGQDGGREAERLMLMSNWGLLLRDVSASVHQDCARSSQR